MEPETAPAGEVGETQSSLESLFGDVYRHGAADHDPRRAADRYEMSLRVEICRSSESEEVALPATLRNISRSGMSLWCRQALEVGDGVRIRVYPSGAPPAWIAAEVVHAEEGRGGVLAGVRFNKPLSEAFEARLVADVRRPPEPTPYTPRPLDAAADDAAPSSALKRVAVVLALCGVSLVTGALLASAF